MAEDPPRSQSKLFWSKKVQQYPLTGTFYRSRRPLVLASQPLCIYQYVYPSSSELMSPKSHPCVCYIVTTIYIMCSSEKEENGWNYAIDLSSALQLSLSTNLLCTLEACPRTDKPKMEVL